MRDTATASSTAAWVAAWRGLAAFLPPPLCNVACDDVSWRLAGYSRLRRFCSAFPRLMRFVLSFRLLGFMPAAMALRAQLIDAAVVDFVKAGGRQILIMGAGFDARAVRLAPTLPPDVRVVEVDAPASAAQKRAGVARLSPALPRLAAWTFVTHDFEREPLPSLAAKLER